MDIATILNESGIMLDVKVNSKKQLFNILADKASELADVDAYDVCNTLSEREKLGSTGVGSGVAIPHGRLASLNRIQGVFATLESPIAYDAVDSMPIDLVFLLLVPEQAGSEHLRVLAKISRMLRDSAFCDKLRGCHQEEAAYVLLTEYTVQDGE